MTYVFIYYFAPVIIFWSTGMALGFACHLLLKS